MWIRIQDKQAIINPAMIEIGKGITKKSKASIYARITNNMQETAVTIGIYESLEIAQKVFSDIEQAILNDKKLFIMPSNEDES